MNTIVHGINEMTITFNKWTVGDLRKRLKQILNVSDDASAYVGGRQVEDSYVLASDDRLEFTKKWGQKGLGRLLTAKELMEEWKISREQYDELIGLGLPLLQIGDEVRHPEFSVDEFFRTFSPKSVIPKMTEKGQADDKDWPILDVHWNAVTYQGRRARLGRKTFGLMKMLVEASGKAVEFVDIGEVIYGQSNTAKNTIHGLRRELRNQLTRDGLGDAADAICTPHGRTEQFFLDRDRLLATGNR